MRKRQYLDLVGNRWVNLDRFYSKIKYNPQTGCDEWTGVFNNIGYGFIGFVDAVTDKRGMMTAHRLALMVKLGREIAPGMNSNHTCHNRKCCTPAHLYEDTQRQKLQTMHTAGMITGRVLGQQIGTYNHQQHNRKYKYSIDEIQWLRNASISDIMQKYNITSTRASSMKGAFRKGYRWLPFEAINQRRGKKPAK